MGYYSFVPNSLGSRWVGLVVVMVCWNFVDSLLVNGDGKLSRMLPSALKGFCF